MPDVVWRMVEKQLRHSVPPSSLASVLGDLAEDYEERRAIAGRLRAQLWLIREGRSLTRAYRAAAAALRADARRIMLADDLRHAWRRVVARPAASLVCAGLLGLGVGLSTAMFSVVDSLLVQPAPFAGGDRLLQQTLFRSEPSVMEAWRSSGLFDEVEATRPYVAISANDRNVTWNGALVTPGVFEMLGVRPLLGRVFTESDARSASDNVVLLSERIWRSTFGGDRGLLGRRITLDDTPMIVIGIMPANFYFPMPATVLWKPLNPAMRDPVATTIVGRVKDGVPWAAAATQVTAVAVQMAWTPASYRVGSAPPVRAVGGPRLSDFIRRALWLLLGGVALVFILLCANVSSLLLAGLSARRREFGMCTALGASRARLLRQATAEHALIGLAGAAAGLGLAWSLTSLVPEVFLGRTLNPIDIDLRALLTASGLGIASVLVSGLIPAWLGTRADPLAAVRASRHAGAETRSARLTTRAFLIGEIALACSLLVGSTLLVRSFANLVETDRGLNSDGVVRVSVGQMDQAFASYDAMTLAIAQIETRFAAWPAIRAVAVSREIPPRPSGSATVRAGAPGPSARPDAEIRADRYRVGASFFDLYEIPILRGRTFQAGDTSQDVIIGERLAGLLWPGQDPLGRSFANGRTPMRVIGVAGEIRLPTLDADLDLPEIYAPMGNDSRTLFINFRCAGACPNEVAVRAQVQAVHPGLTARLVAPTEDEYLTHLQLPRAIAQVGGVFALVAVLTAAGGLFSVLTYSVSRRRREFGIRSALGASPGQIRAGVVREGMSVVAVGVALGVFGGWIVATSLAAFHYGVTAADPVTWAAVIGTVALTALAAAWRPARQAMRVDPVTLLREE